MTDVTISHEKIRDIIYNMGWEPEDAETFIKLAEGSVKAFGDTGEILGAAG